LKIVAAVVGAFLMVPAGLLIWHWPFSCARVTRSLQETLPATVSFTSFRATYFPHPGCVAEGVAFHWLAMKEQSPPIATVAKMKIEAHYLDLLFRPGYLAQILLDGFRVDVPKVGTPHERYSWHETPSHIRVGEIKADGAILRIAREDTESPLIFSIHTATLSSASRHDPFEYAVTFRNPLPPGEITARGKFGPWNSDDPASTPVSGNTSFRDADLEVFHGISGRLSSEGQFGGNLGHIETGGVIEIPDFSVKRSQHAVRVRSSFRAFVNGVNGDVRLERVAARFLGTNVTAEGTIAGGSGRPGKTAELDLFVTEGRIQDVLRLFVRAPKSPLNGMTSFRAHVVWPPSKGPFLHKIRLTGDFGIAGGQFTNAGTRTDLAEFSERARGEKPDDQTEEDKDNIVSNLSGHVELRGGVATVAGLSFQLPGASALMHGTYNLESEVVDLHGTLKTDAEFSHMTSGFKSVLLKPFNAFFKKKHAGALLPAHLVGTYDDPQPGLDILTKGSPAQVPSDANRAPFR